MVQSLQNVITCHARAFLSPASPKTKPMKQESVAVEMSDSADASLMSLLSLPNSVLSERLKRAALQLKDTVVRDVDFWFFNHKWILVIVHTLGGTLGCSEVRSDGRPGGANARPGSRSGG
ncbi:unnamed protein product [Rhodiola kirilowii]